MYMKEKKRNNFENFWKSFSISDFVKRILNFYFAFILCMFKRTKFLKFLTLSKNIINFFDLKVLEVD